MYKVSTTCSFGIEHRDRIKVIPAL
jgi:hypothetical protein